MLRIRFLLCLVIIIHSLQSAGQVLPAEGSKLNYRLVGFSIGQKPRQQVYNIELATGTFNDNTSFSNHVIQVYECTGIDNVLEVPAFGTQYTWRYVYPGAKTPFAGKYYHFSTLYNEHADTSKLRLRIMQPAAVQCRDYYVSVDAGGVLYNMAGSPVWFIPDTNGIGGMMGDLQFTDRPSLTFIRDNEAYEIGFEGSILWRAPRRSFVADTLPERYHHEFRRLSDGHYMIMGMQILFCKEEVTGNTRRVVVSKDGAPAPGYKSGRFGTLVEYDERGKVVWSWKSSDYLIGSDFDYFTGGADTNLRFDPHENAFYFDEQAKIIYLGFRNLNRILKISYPDGKVTGIYGEVFGEPGNHWGKGMFCNQHNIARTRDGLLYYFNNNSCMIVDSMPTIVLLREPVSKDDSLTKVWEYQCTVEGKNKRTFPSGGFVLELADKSFFVCMGSEYSKMFIVNRDKEVLWSALPEKHHPTEQDWRANRQYRANIITRAELERLVWSAEKRAAKR